MTTRGADQAAVLGDCDRRLAHLAAQHHRAPTAGESSGAAGDVHHAHHGSRWVPEFRNQLRTEQGASPRLHLPSIVDDDPRPTSTLPVQGRMLKHAPFECFHRWDRRHQEHRNPETATSFQRDLSRMPAGRALRLESLIVFVEHHDRREVGYRRPHRGPGSHREVDPRARLGPLLRQMGDADPGTPDAGGEDRGVVHSGDDDKSRPDRERARDRRELIG